MCKKKTAEGNSETQTNVGLINVASESFGDMETDTILEVISFIILTLILIRGVRKWLMKRKAKKAAQLRGLLSEAPARQQPRVQNLPMITMQQQPETTRQLINPSMPPKYEIPEREVWTRA